MKLSLLFALISISLFSQTFNGTGGLIPDDGQTEISFTINTSGLPIVADAGFGFSTLCFTIQHTYCGDLGIRLVSPDGTNVSIVQNAGGSSDDFTNTCVEQDAALSIQSQSGPFSGTFKPLGEMGMFNNGSNPNGNWTLYILDDALVDQGTLIDWSISFDNTPAAPPVPFTTSELPIFSINTNAQLIADDPKISADLNIYWGPYQIINTTSQNPHYSGKIGIEYRGSTSQTMFPKKGYGFETWDIDSNQINFPILNFPAESDWILNASYTDKSLLNNTLTYRLYRDFGHYAPRTKHVELVINSEYRGIYILMEKIKRDSNRVDISKLTNLDISGDDLTGGYIIKIDKLTGSGGGGWESQYLQAGSNPSPTFFQYDYPSDVNILPVQQTYIQQYVDSFETALALGPYSVENEGWRQYADEQSFIDFLIINEISKNVDAFRISTFLHKDKNSKGGKLKVGPVWDFDIGYGNVNYCDGDQVGGWAYNYSYAACDAINIPFWWEKLMEEDDLFARKLSCRYKELRSGFLSTEYLYEYIDSVSGSMVNALNRNFDKWPILGNYVWPNPNPIPSDYSGEVNELKSWLQNRLTWLDNNMPYACNDLGVESMNGNTMTIYPNPVNKELSIRSSQIIENCEFFTVSGQKLELDYYSEGNNVKVNTSGLQNGIYLVHVTVMGKEEIIKFIKE